MSNDTLDTDALATEEMLKMFENMENHNLESPTMLESHEPMEEEPVEAVYDSYLSPVEMDIDLPDIEMSDSIDAEIIEMPSANETLTPTTESYIENTPIEVPAEINNASDFIEHPDSSSRSLVLDSEKLDFLDDIIAQKSACTDEVDITNSNTTEVAHLVQTNSVPVTDHLNAVVESAVQALQDWLTLRQHSEENSPATQGLAQLDILLDTVTHQQQQLAEQLNNTPKIDFSGMASALGVSLPTPQAMGWSQEEWRNKAQNVAHKTDDIAAMNAKLRKQLEQF